MPDDTTTNPNIIQNISLSLPPPENFSFQSVEWESWLRRFNRFRVASGLNDKPGNIQVDTLIYIMGPHAETIIENFKLNDSELSDYDGVTKRLTKYFLPKVKIIYERARFNQRFQQPGETAEAFITDLHKLSDKCNYGQMREEFVRDRIVVGISDSKLSKQLQMRDTLTLEEATNQAKASELVLNQQSTVRHDQPATTQLNQVAAVKPKNFHKQNKSKYRKTSSQNQKPQSKPESNLKQCFRCGNEFKNFKDHNCPALSVECKRCGKKGHFSKVCRSEKNIGNLFLGNLNGVNTSEPWVADITIKNKTFSKKINFLLDTGADVTCISEADYNKKMGHLLPEKAMTTGPAGESLQVVGKFSANLNFVQTSVKSDVYVIANLKRPLLGRPALEPLGIIRRIYSVQSGEATSGSWRQKYPGLFKGIGTMPGEYCISLKDDAIPYSVNVARRVPIPLLPKVKKQLEKMVEDGIIEKVTDPTDWCAPMVVVPKPSGDVRITTDFTKLNVAVRRPKYELPSVDDTLAKLGKAKIFTKLDANSGFYQCVLNKNSAHLTTFITPFGRYFYKRLPMGISSAPEIYSLKMATVLEGLDGVLNLMDDLCIFGSNQEEHDKRLHNVLQRLVEAGVTLNSDKCVFSSKSLPYLGYIVDEEGIRPDPNKVAAIRDYPCPTNVSDVRRFLGMVNQLAKFVPRISDITAPLRELIGKNVIFKWDSPQEEAFQNLKDTLISADVIAHYDYEDETRIAADSSNYGVGAVMLQLKGTQWKPIAYASRSLTKAETRYATIEKEALALTWSCERFSQYLIGKHFEILTDHNPLVSLFMHKRLDELPLRIQRFRIRMLRFSYTLRHVPGKEQCSADALSRAPINTTSIADLELNTVVEEYAVASVQSLPATEKRILQIIEKQKVDPILSQVRDCVLHGWPQHIPFDLKIYYSVRSDLTIVKDLLLKSSRIVIPFSMVGEMLNNIHDGHQGIVKCLERARSSIWWPGITSQIKNKISTCNICLQNSETRREPMISTEFPQRPWQIVGTDLFQLGGREYLILVDYYSRYIEMALLNSTSAQQVILHLKSMFARHGVPEVVRSDNGPQYSSLEFNKFSTEYNFDHITSSPLHPRSNGEAERAVKTLKLIMKKTLASNEDMYKGLLAYRATPISNGYSPAELLMGRKLRNPVPEVSQKRDPQLPNSKSLRMRENKYRQKMKQNRDKGSRRLKPLWKGQKVYAKSENKHYTVQDYHHTPRSYILQGADGEYKRRNRSHVVVQYSRSPVSNYSHPTSPVNTKPTVTPSSVHSGTTIKVNNSAAANMDVRRSNRSTKGVLPQRYRD